MRTHTHSVTASQYRRSLSGGEGNKLQRVAGKRSYDLREDCKYFMIFAYHVNTTDPYDGGFTLELGATSLCCR